MKLLEVTSGVMGKIRQHKQNVTSRPTRQLFDELKGQYLGNFREAGEFHRSHVQVDNLVSVTYGSLNTVKTLKMSFLTPTQIHNLESITNHFLLLKARGAPCPHHLE